MTAPSLFCFLATLFFVFGCSHQQDFITNEERGQVSILRNLYPEPAQWANHPYVFEASEMESYLGEVQYIYREILSWSHPRPLFTSEEQIFLAKHLVIAFQHATPRDEIHFVSYSDVFRNEGTLRVKQQSLELEMDTFANESFHSSSSAIDEQRTRWRLSLDDLQTHRTIPEWFGKDSNAYNTLITPLSRFLKKKSQKTSDPSPSPSSYSGSALELDQKWLNEEIEREKRKEEELLSK
jgi:hypothetical protein